MLAKPNRLTRGADYRTTVRRGERCSGAHSVVYVRDGEGSASARFGFIVSKQVGGAVMRNTVRRRLKAVCAEALPLMRPSADIVIRALPSSATTEFAALREDVLRCLRRKGAR